MPVERLFDFRRFDPDASHFDLSVEPSQQLQVAVRSESGAIARAIEPRSARVFEGVLDEMLGRQLRVSEILSRDTLATEVQLTRSSCRRKCAMFVQHVRRTPRIGRPMGTHDV